jgi:hypothetical protein
MGCCGEKRANMASRWQTEPATLRQSEAGDGKQSPASSGEIKIRYLKSRLILVRGPITGRH